MWPSAHPDYRSTIGIDKEARRVTETAALPPPCTQTRMMVIKGALEHA